MPDTFVCRPSWQTPANSGDECDVCNSPFRL